MRGGRKAGQCGAAGVSNGVYVCVWYTCVCVYLWQQPFWCCEVTLLQPQTCIGYWFHVLVLSGSMFGCKALTAAQENTGGGRLADVRHIKHTVDHVRLLLCLGPGDIKVCTSVSNRFRCCWVIALSVKMCHSEDSETSRTYPSIIYLYNLSRLGPWGGWSLSLLSLGRRRG